MCSKIEHSPLLVIADDLTGALDTGVQFSKSGAKTKIITLSDLQAFVFPSDVDVIVVDTETRHLEPYEAYRIVKELVSLAEKSGVTYFYKKTDSLLRGNVGAELSALMDGANKEVLLFFPSFPQIGRIVRDGVLYIDNVPVTESNVAKDLFNPVPSSSISSIVGRQTSKPVFSNPDSFSLPGIYVFDSETEDEMREKAEGFGKKGLSISAGCAGFASVLCEILGFTNREKTNCDNLDDNLLVISGTPNNVTLSQLDFAEKNGMTRLSLPNEMKDEPEISEENLKSFAMEVLDRLKDSGWVAVDVGKPELQQITESKEGTAFLEIKRKTISKNIGKLVRCIFDYTFDATTLVVGGDVLFSTLKEMNIKDIYPQCEIQPGVVLLEINYGQKKYKIATKSGGFGNESLISNLYKKTKEGAV